MKQNKHLAIALGLVATVTMASVATAATLPQMASNALITALEDEYLAEATYAAVLDKFGNIRPFSNIINAERTHQNALKQLLTTYGVEIPQNPYFSGAKKLDELPATKTEACKVGVEAEIANLALYDDKLLPQVAEHPDIIQVFTNLKNASEFKHLPAFQRCAGR